MENNYYTIIKKAVTNLSRKDKIELLKSAGIVNKNGHVNRKYKHIYKLDEV